MNVRYEDTTRRYRVNASLHLSDKYHLQITTSRAQQKKIKKKVRRFLSNRKRSQPGSHQLPREIVPKLGGKVCNIFV